MENIKVKTYIISKGLKDLWPQNKFVYTIECYGSSRTWNDSNFSVMWFLKIDIEDYITTMKIKFDCIEHENKLFFSTRQQCEEAIKFIDHIKIMNELSQ